MRKDRLTVSAGSAQTDSLGRYQIRGLKADNYYVYACPPPFCTTDGNDRHMRGALTFHPSGRDLATASRVSILPAGEISDVDIVVEWPATYDLTGLVLDRWGRPRGDLPVLLFPGSDVWIAVSAHARTAPNGRFRLEGIPAGTYVLQSGSGVKVDHPVFAAAIVNLSEDSRDFVLHATEGGTITGDIVFEASGVDFTPNQLAIAVRGEDFSRTPVAPLGGASVTIDDDWAFEARNVWGPHKLEILEIPTGWMLKAVESQGIDHTDGTVDPNSSVRVTFTQRVSGIAGTVLDGKGKLVPGATVIVFSTDSAHWELPSRRVRRINSDTSAHFALRLPPGDYYALAVECLPDDRMFRSDVLQNLASHATVITVREGRTEPADLILY